jgi:hypothetical protein
MAVPNALVSPAGDRRHYVRFEGQGVAAIIGSAIIDVQDISMGGIRFATNPTLLQPKDEVRMVLMPRDGKALRINEGIHISGQVVGVAGTEVRIAFHRPTYAIAKLIVRCTADSLGVEPHMVK